REPGKPKRVVIQFYLLLNIRIREQEEPMSSLKVSPNGRYFVDDRGAPFFWLGDTQWELFRAVTQEEAAEIIQRRLRQRFTVLQVMVTGVGDGTAPNRAGQTPWEGNDPATPNEAYFRNADDVIQQAGQEGMILVLGVFHQLQVDRITPANAR